MDEGWVERVAGIRRWARNGERAPHKPLLLLYALGRLHANGSSRTSYAEAEPALQQLLRDYGPSGRTTSPAYPFHHLQTDRLWTVTTADGTDPGASVGQLRARGAVGQLAREFEAALLADPAVMALIVRLLLDENFPESVHADICALVGIDIEALEVDAARRRVVHLGERVRRRDPAFRANILVAYEYRCAVCGYDGRLGSESVGLDAAHVRWWAFDGPDDVANGLCLCAMHHKLFDRGVLGVTPEHVVQVSRHFVGRGDAAANLVLGLIGRALLEPQPGLPALADEHIGWHADQVFRGPARPAA